MAGRVCTICGHPKRKAIDKALAVGNPERATAKQYEVSHSALHRHAARCLKNVLEQRKAQNETSLVSEIETVLGETLADLHRIAKSAEKARQFKAAVDAITQRTEIALKKWHLFSAKDEQSTNSEQDFRIEIKEAIRPEKKAEENNLPFPVKSDSSDQKPVFVGSAVQ